MIHNNKRKTTSVLLIAFIILSFSFGQEGTSWCLDEESFHITQKEAFLLSSCHPESSPPTNNLHNSDHDYPDLCQISADKPCVDIKISSTACRALIPTNQIDALPQSAPLFSSDSSFWGVQLKTSINSYNSPPHQISFSIPLSALRTTILLI